VASRRTPAARTAGTTSAITPSPPDDLVSLSELSQDQLIALVEEALGGGITVSFSGKANATRIARKVRPRVVRRMPSLSIGHDEAQAANFLIEGDNLQAMSTLYRERGHVDLILTDPPFNTGRDFRYNDRWEEDPNDPGMGDLVSLDDGARHTKWMRFMWPRLQMMRSMLKPGGVLAICIDHRELFRLGQMLDELFGEANRLAIINWQKSYAPRGDRSHVSTATEYVLVYAKDEERAKTRLLPRSDEMDARYKAPDGDPRAWKSGDFSAGKGPSNQGMVYAIQSPFTGELHYPPPTCCWRPAPRNVLDMVSQWGPTYKFKTLNDDEKRAELLSIDVKDLKPARAIVLAEPLKTAREKALKRLKAGRWPRIYFGLDGQGRPSFKRYLDEVKQGKVVMSYWADDDYDEPLILDATSWAHPESGHSQTGITELDNIVGDKHGFATVKPLRLFEKLIQIWCPPEGMVLDPFAGSGTTGHAVLDLNAMTGSNRRFILVEQGRPERGDPYASSLTANRLRRVVTGDWVAGPQPALGGGFCFQRLDKRVDAQALLKMERDEMVDTVIASHFDGNRKRGPNLIRLDPVDKRYLVAKNSDDEGFFLVWDGPDKNTDFSAEVYDACAEEAEAAGLKPFYHVYARLYLYQTENVRFYQIPDRILADFGLDMSSEPFADLS
jgi:adenine-specific DNA-methyltransferase